jgi:hypothetical protein
MKQRLLPPCAVRDGAFAHVIHLMYIRHNAASWNARYGFAILNLKLNSYLECPLKAKAHAWQSAPLLDIHHIPISYHYMCANWLASTSSVACTRTRNVQIRRISVTLRVESRCHQRLLHLRSYDIANYLPSLAYIL